MKIIYQLIMMTMAKNTTVEVSEYPKCDFCGLEAHYDGKVNVGNGWTNMCDFHFKKCGQGLGLGRGQKLILNK